MLVKRTRVAVLVSTKKKQTVMIPLPMDVLKVQEVVACGVLALRCDERFGVWTFIK